MTFFSDFMKMTDLWQRSVGQGAIGVEPGPQKQCIWHVKLVNIFWLPRLQKDVEYIFLEICSFFIQNICCAHREFFYLFFLLRLFCYQSCELSNMIAY